MKIAVLRTVRHKILLMVLAVNVCTLLVAGAALLYHDLVAAREGAANDLYTLAGIVGEGSTASLQFDDPKVATESLSHLRAHQNIRAAAIYDAQGRPFAYYRAADAASDALPATPAVDGTFIAGSRLAVSRPILAEKEKLGSVYLLGTYDLGPWLRAYLLTLGGVLLVSLALGMLVSSWLQRWVSEPILSVGALAHRVMGTRDYGLRATKTTEDEVGELADSFNGMLQTLEHEIAERRQAETTVLELNADLERRVTARTTELQQTNDALVARTEEAEAANRAKADFLANMSHEIRTPMNAVLGLAYLLDQRHLDNDSAELVRKIRNAGRSLQSIINDILDFSKIEAGRLDIEHAPFQLGAILENLAAIMSANAGSKDVELLISPAPDIGGQLIGDALRLEQILINLTGNAIKFTEHGMVGVKVDLLARSERQATLRFAVTDTGIGIATDKQQQVFAAFAQADTSTTRRFGGTGLGLAICKHLVTRMGGEIGVISEPGRGSEFWFTVPLEWTQDGAFAPEELSHLEVLIVDDSDVARENLTLTARSIGWVTSQADSGRLAVQKVAYRLEEQRPFDVLLLDWQMPGMSGLQAATQIRQQLNDQVSPIVLMVTAFSRDELLKQDDIGLVDEVLSKPVTASALFNGVARALKRRGKGSEPVAAATTEAAPRLQGIRVLVVDDSDTNREVALRILEAHGAEVALANDGQAALDWLGAHVSEVDIVLMDVQMPVMDGYEAARHLREDPQLRHLPVVALTAGAFKSQQDEAKRAGMDAFVSKPFEIEALLGVILALTAPRQAASTAPAPAAKPGDGAQTDLPGLQVSKGLDIWLEAKPYADYLRRFLNEHGDAPAKLTQLRADGSLAASRSLAHKIRGAAANLALVDIAAITARIEHAGPEERGAVKAAIDELGTALAVAETSIATFVARLAPPAPHAQSPAPPSTDGHDDAVLPLLEQLVNVLDDDNADRAEPLLDQLEPMLPAAMVEALRNCIAGFDFRGAQTLARTLSEGLQTT